MIKTETVMVSFVGNGSNKSFQFPYKLNEAKDIAVWLSDGTSLKKVANYSITPASGSYPTVGGTITYPADNSTAMDKNHKIYILRDMPILQLTEYARNNSLSLEDLEKSFDSAVMMIQELKEKVGRAVHNPLDEDGIELPYPEEGNVLVWQDGELVNYDKDNFLSVLRNIRDTTEGYKNTAVASQQAAKVSETNAKVSETRALDSEQNAKTSETHAKTSEDNSKDSEISSKKWAMANDSPDGKEDTDSSTGLTQSSKTWALYAKDRAKAAADSEAEAKTSEVNAKKSETKADQRATDSDNSATAAANSATAAANSATAAANSATAAANSESNAKQSEHNAEHYAQLATATNLVTHDELAEGVTTKNLTVSGETSVPTANEGNSSKAIANTEFVSKSISALVNGAPEQLNTLNELADALGDDKNFSATVTAELGKKIDSKEAEDTYATKKQAGVPYQIKRNTAYNVGDVLTSPDLPPGYIIVVTTAGTTGSTEPDWDSIRKSGGGVSDGTTAYKIVSVNGLADSKQDKLTWDSTPTSGSSNPVTSDGVRKAIDEHNYIFADSGQVEITGVLDSGQITPNIPMPSFSGYQLIGCCNIREYGLNIPPMNGYVVAKDNCVQLWTGTDGRQSIRAHPNGAVEVLGIYQKI